MFSVASQAENLYYRWIHRRTRVSIGGYNGVFLTPSAALHSRVVRFGGESVQLAEFLRELRAGDVVWDVGSLVGLYSLFASKAVGSTGKVYAFEPEAEAAVILRQNCRLNQVGNVIILEAALSDTDGDGELFLGDQGEKAIHSLKPRDGIKKKGVHVTLHRGDTLIVRSEAEAPNAIKMDIEGAECLALEGLNETLVKPACRFVLLELHHHALARFGSRSEDVVSFMLQAGFEIRRKMERGTESHLFFHKR